MSRTGQLARAARQQRPDGTSRRVARQEAGGAALHAAKGVAGQVGASPETGGVLSHRWTGGHGDSR